MKLNVISPHAQTLYSIVWLEINTPEGNMVIQKDHAPMIIEIEPNSELLFMLESGKQMGIVVLQGFMHITRQDIKLLVTKEA